MKNFRLTSIYLLIIVTVTLGVALPVFKGDLILNDPFHHGEFFAGTVALFPDIKSVFIPLSIHGALDFIPALFAEYQWGPDNYFLPTMAIYKALHFFAAIFYVLIAYDLTKSKDYQWMMILAAAAIAPFVVGYRDLFLLISVYLFIKIFLDNVICRASILLQILFGLIVAFGMYWSYDRGIAGVLSLGVGVLILLFRNKFYVISLVSFFVTVYALSLGFEIFSIQNYFENVYILMQTSGQWNYAWSKGTVIFSAFSVALNITAISLFVADGLRSKSIVERIPLIVLFGMLAIFMLKIGLNRADLRHIYFTLWVPVLIFFFLYDKKSLIKWDVGFLIVLVAVTAMAMAIFYWSYPFLIVGAVLFFLQSGLRNESFNKFIVSGFGLLVVCYTSLVLYSGVKDINRGQYTWLRTLESPRSNRMSVPDGVVWVSDRLSERAVECVFDLSNHGLINGLLRLPSCSRFTYPVYAGSQHESIIISDLRKASPPAIVYSSTSRSYHMDGKSMKKRFPALDEFILKNYPIEECANGYCVRYKVREHIPKR